MLLRSVLLAAAIAGSEAFYMAQPVSPKLDKMATYEGAWPLFTSSSCPSNFSVACAANTEVIQSCCPSGNTCFGGNVPYCCPTGQDCKTYVDTFPVCVDPSANMYMGGFGGYFCCENGLIGVLPSGNTGLCQGPGQVIPVSLLATMTSQIGGTSVTPFLAAYGTATGAAVSSAVVTAPGTANPSITASASSAQNTAANAGSTSNASSGSHSGWSPTNGQITGLAIAAAFILGLIYIIWSRLSKRRARKEALLLSAPYPGNSIYNTSAPSPYNAPSARVNQYMPPPRSGVVSPLTPAPRYDPVTERLVGGMSPSPEYKVVDTHDSGGRISVSEVPAVSTAHRVEMG